VISHENITARKKSELDQIRQNERLASLVRVAQSTSNNTQELLETSLEEAIRITKSTIGCIALHDENGQN